MSSNGGSSSTISLLDSDKISGSKQQQTSSASSDLTDDAYQDPLPWILFQILESELLDGLPLRIMFSFNSGERLPSLRDVQTWWSNHENGQKLIHVLGNVNGPTPSSLNPTTTFPASREHHHPQDRFMDAANEELLNIDFFSMTPRNRTRTQGLPPKFIEGFCLQHFPATIEGGDFNLALTAIDYLQDYENARRQCLRAAAYRIGINKENWREVLKTHPHIALWVEEVQDAELHIEEWYASLYIGLRIWTMVKELQAVPFYKPNILALLNTLFPPNVQQMPNHLVTPPMLTKYRSTFYEYVGAIDRDGSRVLQPLVDSLGRGRKHSWGSIRSSLESYFGRSKELMHQANEFEGITYMRRTDSLFGDTQTSSDYTTSERPVTASSAASSVDRTTAFPPRQSSHTEEPSIRHMSHEACVYTQGEDEQCGGEAMHGHSEHEAFWSPKLSPAISEEAAVKVGSTKEESIEVTDKIRPQLQSFTENESTADSDDRRPEVNTGEGDATNLDPQPSKASQPSVPPKSVLRSALALPSPCIPHEVFTRLPDSNIDQRYHPTPNLRNTSYEKRPRPFKLGSNGPFSQSRFATALPSPLLTDEGNDISNCQTPTILGGPTHASSVKTLPSDRFEFLNRPYTEPSTEEPRVKKKSSMLSLFSRKKSSTTLSEGFNDDNALGITTTPATSSEDFSKCSDRLQPFNDAKSEKQSNQHVERPVLRSMRSKSLSTEDAAGGLSSNIVHKAKSFTSLFRKNQQAVEGSVSEDEAEAEQSDKPCSCCPDGGVSFKGVTFPPRPLRPSEACKRPGSASSTLDTEQVPEQRPSGQEAVAQTPEQQSSELPAVEQTSKLVPEIVMPADGATLIPGAIAPELAPSVRETANAPVLRSVLKSYATPAPVRPLPEPPVKIAASGHPQRPLPELPSRYIGEPPQRPLPDPPGRAVRTSSRTPSAPSAAFQIPTEGNIPSPALSSFDLPSVPKPLASSQLSASAERMVIQDRVGPMFIDTPEHNLPMKGKQLKKKTSFSAEAIFRKSGVRDSRGSELGFQAGMEYEKMPIPERKVVKKKKSFWRKDTPIDMTTYQAPQERSQSTQPDPPGGFFQLRSESRCNQTGTGRATPEPRLQPKRQQSFPLFWRKREPKEDRPSSSGNIQSDTSSRPGTDSFRSSVRQDSYHLNSRSESRSQRFTLDDEEMYY